RSIDRCARGMPSASKIFITSRVVNVWASLRVADMVGLGRTMSDSVGRGRSWSDDVGLNCWVSSLIRIVYTAHRKRGNERYPQRKILKSMAQWCYGAHQRCIKRAQYNSGNE